MIKRFIAGAVCPRCSERDKLRAWINAEGTQYRECVRCGFEDAIYAQPPGEIETRVNKPRRGHTTSEDIKPIRFIPDSED